MAVTTCEGGYWKRPFGDRVQLVHAVLFEGGNVWDAKNGWRLPVVERLEPVDPSGLMRATPADELAFAVRAVIGEARISRPEYVGIEAAGWIDRLAAVLKKYERGGR